MLSIPDPVKALFKRDTVRKNIRLTWENGRADITNTQLVAESLRFRESICSSDAIAFGTAEASTLEFETVGVENLFGLWFRAYIEVDASGLPEDLQEARPDLSFPVYSIPLGRFIVTACPRNHEALAHRKFSASNKLGALSTILPSELISAALNGISAPDAAGNNDWVMKVNADRFRVYSGLIQPDSSLPLVNSVTTNLSDAIPFVTARITAIRAGGSIPEIRVIGAQPAGASLSGLTDKTVYATVSERVGAYDLNSIAWRLYSAMSNGRTITDSTGTRITSAVAVEYITEALRPLAKYLDAGFYLYHRCDYRTGGVPRTGASYSFPANGTELALPPVEINHDPDSEDGAVLNYNFIRNVMGLSIGVGSTSWGQYNLLQSTSCTISLYRLPDDMATGRTANTDAVTTTPEQPQAVLTDALNQSATIMRSLTDTAGGFYAKDREGRPVMKRMSTEPVETIGPGSYSSCWIEEQDVEPIGAIKYTMAGDDYTLVIGEGRSVYQLASVDFYERAGLTPDQVAERLQADLVPALANLSYTPVELEALGLPYLEAGDHIEVELEDGTRVQTYVLERNLEGIQHLTDSIIADGVTVQELEAAELEDET